jgi:hypothetical protein
MESPASSEPRKVPQGEYLGTLRWYAADGTLRSWVITQGDRANNIEAQAKQKRVICGWDRFLVGLRKHLSISKRIFGLMHLRKCGLFYSTISNYLDLFFDTRL